ncbi:MAG: HD domain-containing protein [bacterium]|nr:HD domain-containing protein [bacterium]MDD5756422.1 HD domain-containing protein [bacterium]
MRFGIDKKIIILVTLVIGILGGFFSIYFINQEKKALLVELDERAYTLLNSVVNSCEYPVLIADQDSISRIAKGAMQQKDVISCEIENRSGKMLFKDSKKTGQQTRSFSKTIITEKIKSSAGAEELILGTAPVEKEMESIGNVRLVFSLDSVTSKLELANKTIWIIGAIGMLLAAIGSSWFIRIMLGKPIDQLVIGTQNIARGDLDYKVPVKTNDEIGLLASSFNRMAENLQKITVTRDYLEKQVELRTAELSEINEKLVKEIIERTMAEEKVHQSLAQQKKVLEGIINAMALTLEMRDAYTAGHQRRVANLASAIAKEMNLSEDQVEMIRIAGVLHDIGKICVPAEILTKPRALDKNEFNLMKLHPQVAFDILKNIDFAWPIAKIVVQHHERPNGSGYPKGLVGDQILLEAKILGVADVVEAMASDRPYRPALSMSEALAHISQNKGTLYDPVVVDACIRVVSKEGFKFE